MKLMLTKKEVFQIKLHGEPIKLDMTSGDGRWVWPEMMEFFYEVDVLKLLPDGDVEVLYEIHAELPYTDKEKRLDGGELISRTVKLRVGQILHKPPAGIATGVRYER
jgi:hypothetical protein